MGVQATLRIVADTDPCAFHERVARCLARREGENSYLLSILPELQAGGPRAGLRLLAVEEERAITAAGVVFPNGALCITWAGVEEADALVDYLLEAGVDVQHVHGPGPAARLLAGIYASRTGRRSRLARAERVYQLAEIQFQLPLDGRLERATPAERDLALAWLERFVAETAMEMGGRSIEPLADALLADGRLFWWKRPEPVAMAAWVTPLAHSAAINFVYTPEPLRRRGHGKAVSAALAARMLAGGVTSCLILADVRDARTHGLYQSIGAQVLCECARYAIV